MNNEKLTEIESKLKQRLGRFEWHEDCLLQPSPLLVGETQELLEYVQQLDKEKRECGGEFGNLLRICREAKEAKAELLSTLKPLSEMYDKVGENDYVLTNNSDRHYEKWKEGDWCVWDLGIALYKINQAYTKHSGGK